MLSEQVSHRIAMYPVVGARASSNRYGVPIPQASESHPRAGLNLKVLPYVLSHFHNRLQGIFKDSKSLIHLFLCNRQWRNKTNHITKRATGQNQ